MSGCSDCPIPERNGQADAEELSGNPAPLPAIATDAEYSRAVAETHRLLKEKPPRPGGDEPDLAHWSDLVDVFERKSEYWGDKDVAEVDTILKQFETLRQEILNALNNRSQVTSFGLGAIGVLGAGALTVDNNPDAVLLVFNAAIPLIVVFTLTLWMDEVERGRRAGRYIATQVEPQINRKFRRRVLAWESMLGTHAWGAWSYVRRMSAAILVVILLGSPVLGVRVADRDVSLWPQRGRSPEWWLVVPWVLAGLPVAFLMYRFSGGKHGKEPGESPAPGESLGGQRAV